MIDQFAAALREELQEQIELHKARVVAGNCATFD